MTLKKSPPRGDFAKRMSALLGSEAECQLFFEALEVLQAKGLEARALRPNFLKLKTQSWDLEKLLHTLGVEKAEALSWNKKAFRVSLSHVKDLDNHPALGAGLFYLQEMGASEVVPNLNVQPGELVLDLCAAPGAKSTQIGELLEGQGWLLSNDPQRQRAERLEGLLSRHGILNSSVSALDPTRLAEEFPDFFDKILVDAPCSGESLFAKRSELRKEVGDAEVEGAARRQFLILSRAAMMLRPGGRLIYSTCTYSREENEDIVDGFLKRHDNFKKVFEQRRWPHKDGVAGGYFAILERAGDESSAEAKDLRFARLLGRDMSGLLRHGPKNWDGEWSDYSILMASTPLENCEEYFAGYDDKVFTPCALPMKEARSYLLGESLRDLESLRDKNNSPGKKTDLVLTWEGFALGSGRFVEDRVNNLLPKRLRGLKRS